MKRFLLPTLTVFIAVACDWTEPQQYVPTYHPEDDTPIAQQEFCALQAREVCAILRPCCTRSPFAFDEGKCHTVSRSLCEARRARAHAAGLTYDPVRAGRCVHGASALVRECFLVTTGDDPVAYEIAVVACANVWHGEKKVGQPCEGTRPLECVPSPGRLVTCVSSKCVSVLLLQGGEDCGSIDPATPRACGPGLECRGLGAGKTCTARYHALESPCVHDSQCGMTSAASPLATDDVYCDALTHVCTRLPIGGEVCVPLPEKTEDVRERRCARGFRCDTERTGPPTCVDGKAVGAQCNGPAECASGFCLQQICLPSGIADPSSCNGAPLLVGGATGAGGFAPIDITPN